MAEKFVLPDISIGLPVFPLPEIVLFPHSMLPLHVFEPRYRQMVEHVIERLPDDRLLAMGTLMPETGPRTVGDPPVHEICGVGRLFEWRRLEDGRYVLVLQGIGRARLTREETSPHLYRLFGAHWLAELDAPEDFARPLAAELKALTLAVARESPQELKVMIRDEDDLGALVDLVSAYLPFDLEYRLAQIENVVVLGRAAHAIGVLEGRLTPPRYRPHSLDDNAPSN